MNEQKAIGSDDYGSAVRRRQGSLVRPLLGVALASFLFGGVLVGYVAYRLGDGENGRDLLAAIGVEREAARPLPASAPSPVTAAPRLPTAATVPGTAPTPAPAASAIAQVAQQQGGLDQRLAAAEQRLARLDLQAQAASGNVARAEGLLIAFAARRALERGSDLGYLGDQLQLRFGDAMPNAVNTVIAVSRDPVTSDQLLARLDGLAPRLIERNERPSWSRLSEELGNLFVIRRKTTPSTRPEERLQRARLFLESGRVEPAIAEVRKMPGASAANEWIADAQRYAAAQRALDLIETAAVLEPRRLRDGAGQVIEQPSPAEPIAPG